MRSCVACLSRILLHDKYVILGKDTFKHRRCATPTEYDWRYIESIVTIPNREWQKWLQTGLDPEACCGKLRFFE
jgi:hypothetical protein